MLEAEVGEVTQDVQALAGGNVPVSALLDLREQPRLDQRTPTKTGSGSIRAALTQTVPSKQTWAGGPTSPP